MAQGLFDFLNQPGSQLAFGGPAGSSGGITPNFTGGGVLPDTPMATQSILGEASQVAPPNANAALQAGPPAAGDYKQPGFLDRLGTPDSRGRTFGDKLYAAGTVAMGQDPSSYLQDLRQEAEKSAKEKQAKTIAAQAAQAMSDNIDPVTNNINARGYAAAMAKIGQGIDPAVYAKLVADASPEYSSVNVGDQAGAFNKRTGQISNLVQGNPTLPTGYVRGPNGGMMIDPGYAAGQRQIFEAKDQLQAQYRAPPRPRAGPAAGPGLAGLTDKQLLDMKRARAGAR